MDNDIGTVIESAFSIQVPLEAKGIQRATRRACNASIEASEFRPGIGDSETPVLPMVGRFLLGSGAHLRRSDRQRERGEGLVNDWRAPSAPAPRHQRISHARKGDEIRSFARAAASHAAARYARGPLWPVTARSHLRLRRRHTNLQPTDSQAEVRRRPAWMH
jgi:hypothetical protein